MPSSNPGTRSAEPAETEPSTRPAGAEDGFLRDIWYFALPSSDLRPGRMLARMLLGEPMLLGRAADGSVFALRDIYPHRGIPLPDGRFDGDRKGVGEGRRVSVRVDTGG